jgi:hypothetical protein
MRADADGFDLDPTINPAATRIPADIERIHASAIFAVEHPIDLGAGLHHPAGRARVCETQVHGGGAFTGREIYRRSGIAFVETCEERRPCLDEHFVQSRKCHLHDTHSLYGFIM